MDTEIIYQTKRKCKTEIKKQILEVYNATEDVDGFADRCGTQIAEDITYGNIDVLNVVDILGDKLSSQDVQERALAINILYYAFKALSSDLLCAEELICLVDFLCNRLNDQHVVVPKVILCLYPIIQCKNLPNGSCSKVLNQLFKEVNVQSHIHRHRRIFFLSLQYMLKFHLEELKENCGNDFVMHFLQSMDGEKDPRNLLILFTCIPTILSNFPYSPFVEDFFEVLSCYFPVDFTPNFRIPGQEVITREDLMKTLHLCLSHTHLFSPFLIPLILEKLDSNLIDAKLDALNLFAMCCDRCYTPADISEFISALWHAIRREIFLGGKETVEEASIALIRSAFKVISRDSTMLKESVTMIFSECKHHLSEPELRLSQPTSRILIAIAESNESSCSEVFGITLSLLHQQFLENSLPSNRKALLNIMKKLISTLSAYPSLSIGDLLTQWDEIVGVWFTLLSHSDPEFVVLTLDLFCQLFVNKGSYGPKGSQSFDLDIKYRNILQEHLYTLVMKPELSQPIGSSAIFLMEHFAYSFGDEIVNILLPKLLNTFHEKEMADAELNPTVSKAISECSANSAVGRVSIPVLLELVSSDEVNNDVISCLASTVNNISKAIGENRPDVKELINFIFNELDGMTRLIKAVLQLSSVERIESSESLTKSVGILLRNADQPTQQHLINLIWNTNVMKNDVSKRFDDLPVTLAEAIFETLYPTVKIEKKEELINVLIEKTSPILGHGKNFPGNKALNSSNQDDLTGIVRLLAVFLNKMEENDFTLLLEQIESIISNILPMVSRASGKRLEVGDVMTQIEDFDINKHEEKETIIYNAKWKSALSLLIWTTKALAMRGFPNVNVWIEKLIHLLDSEELGSIAADGFSTILSDSDSSLKLENHCIYKFLYKQRVFLISVPKLIESYRQCSAGAERFKVNYIKALSCQLKHISKSLLHTQLVNVVPLLVAGLNLNELASKEQHSTNQLVLLSSLKALYELFDSEQSSESIETTPAEPENRQSSLIEYFHDLTPRLLALSTFKDNMEVRVVALKCLQRCAKFPSTVVLQLKDQVVRELKKCLGDSKRLVRKEAVTTRNMWILASAPGGI